VEQSRDLLFCCARCRLSAFSRLAQAADKPGIIAGKVTSTGEVPLSEMVVYLESGDGKYELVVPKETIKVSQKGAKFARPSSSPASARRSIF